MRNMWLNSAIFALLTVAGATLVTPTEYHVHLNHSENKLDVSLGSSLVLHCCLERNKSERCRVKFFFQGFNQTNQDQPIKPLSCHNTTDLPNCNMTGECQSKCKLFNISKRNCGFYFCKVISEIPTLNEVLSNRTQVTLGNLMEKTTVHSQTTSQVKEVVRAPADNRWMWIIIGVSSLVLIVVALLVICAVQKRLCNRDREEPIYINTHLGKRSPRLMPAAENLKTVSSSQDLRTPSNARRYEERNQRYRD